MRKQDLESIYTETRYIDMLIGVCKQNTNVKRAEIILPPTYGFSKSILGFADHVKFNVHTTMILESSGRPLTEGDINSLTNKEWFLNHPMNGEPVKWGIIEKVPVRCYITDLDKLDVKNFIHEGSSLVKLIRKFMESKEAFRKNKLRLRNLERAGKPLTTIDGKGGHNAAALQHVVLSTKMTTFREMFLKYTPSDRAKAKYIINMVNRGLINLNP